MIASKAESGITSTNVQAQTQPHPSEVRSRTALLNAREETTPGFHPPGASLPKLVVAANDGKLVQGLQRAGTGLAAADEPWCASIEAPWTAAALLWASSQALPTCPKLDRVRFLAMGQHQSIWPDQVPGLAAELHMKLVIGDRDWHRLKTKADRRAAELLAAALAQLINGGKATEVAGLTQQALGWINGELKDPGCPRH